jgi:hypothetical protein
MSSQDKVFTCHWRNMHDWAALDYVAHRKGSRQPRCQYPSA